MNARCLLLALLAVLVGAPVDAAPAADELVLYSGRKEMVVKPVAEAFQKKTGIQVRLKIGKTSGLANELIQEKARPRADVFIATEAGVMEILAKNGVLGAYISPETKGMESGFFDREGLWTGISSRARVILYNKNLVAEKDIPRSVFQLADPRWKEKVAIAGTRERTTLSWVSSLVAVKGTEFTRSYLAKLHENGLKVLPDNADVWQGVGRGEFAVGLTNSPNYFLARKADYPVGVVYPDQDDGGPGTLLNLNAIALVKGAANPAAARRFIDFVLSAEGQRILVDGAYEIPLKPDIIDPVPLTGFRRTPVTEEQLADLAEATLKLLAGVGPEW
ncbi:MAG: extracellular solute-binding protein [Nitrospirae bacterium]|nr:MAG: extracellular solute-binding protein [Nitrospirota bacterium]